MKRIRAIAVAAAGMAAAATMATGAGTASAASVAYLCVAGQNICAEGNGGQPVKMEATSSPGIWLYNGYNHPGQIQQSNTSLCLQLDHANSNTVIEAACNGANYQSWDGFQIVSSNGGYIEGFKSDWNTGLCLTYNADHHWLDVVGCNSAWYQSFTYYSTS